MKLTVNQLRRIIKEEVQKVVKTKTSKRRSLRETLEEDASFEIPDISSYAELADMSVEEFCDMVKEMGSKYSSIEFGPANALHTGDGYSAEYDSLLAHGNRAELEALARDLDVEDFGGNAQSASGEYSFLDFIQDI
jgi:hypothetical protein